MRMNHNDVCLRDCVNCLIEGPWCLICTQEQQPWASEFFFSKHNDFLSDFHAKIVLRLSVYVWLSACHLQNYNGQLALTKFLVVLCTPAWIKCYFFFSGMSKYVQITNYLQEGVDPIHRDEVVSNKNFLALLVSFLEKEVAGSGIYYNYPMVN